jgi:hypothetical protein
MNKILYKSAIVYILELWRLLLFGIILGAILIILSRVNLFLYIYIPVAGLVLFLTVRRFYFYEDKIVVNFLYKKDNVLFENVKRITFRYMFARDNPIIIIETMNNKNLLGKLYYFVFFRFVLSDYDELVFLLKNLKKNGVEIEIKSTETYTNKIKNDISK